MSVNVKDLMPTSLDTIDAYDMEGNLKFSLDELQEATVSHTQEANDITGKQGRLLGTIKQNKGVTISATNGLLSSTLMADQMGSEFESGTQTVAWTETLSVKGDKTTTTYEASGTTGAEISAVYVIASDGVVNFEKTLTQASAASDGKFAYDTTTKEITFASGALEDGTEVVVCYNRSVEGVSIQNLSGSYSSVVHLIIHGTAEDKCHNVYHIAYDIPYADIEGNFDVTLGGDQTVHNFEARALSGSCGSSGEFYKYYVFED